MSSDKDFIQLHSDTVKQWSPVTKKELNGHDPTEELNEINKLQLELNAL